MGSASSMFEVGSEVLGYVGLTASWRRGDKRYQPMLVIFSASSTDDGTYTPAETVTINSREGLLSLRKAIDEALKEQITEYA